MPEFRSVGYGLLRKDDKNKNDALNKILEGLNQLKEYYTSNDVDSSKFEIDVLLSDERLIVYIHDPRIGKTVDYERFDTTKIINAVEE